MKRPMACTIAATTLLTSAARAQAPVAPWPDAHATAQAAATPAPSVPPPPPGGPPRAYPPPPPPVYLVQEAQPAETFGIQTREGRIAQGTGLLLLSYGTSTVIGGYLLYSPEPAVQLSGGLLLVPVLGPIALVPVMWHNWLPAARNSDLIAYSLLLLANAGLQATGLIILGEGLLRHDSPHPVRAIARAAPPRARWAVSPVAPGAALGASLSVLHF